MTTTQTDRLSGVLGNTAIKTPCAVATTAAITLFGEQIIDGVTTSASRVLVKNQASAIDNGIYLSDTGAWERTQDFDGSRDVVEGTLVKVNGGSTTVGFWYVTTTGSPVPGTDAINFGQASTVLAVVTAWAQNILSAASAAAAWVFIKVGAIADANTWAGTQTFASTIFNGAATHNADITMVGASIVEAEGAAVTAASSTNIWATDGNTVHVTGNTGINDFATAPQAGAWMKVIFDGTPLLTQSANLNLNAGGSNITIAAGDIAYVYADTTTQMDVVVFRKSGAALSIADASITAAKLDGAQSGSAPIYGARAWCVFDGTTAGTNAPTAGGNVSTLQRESAGVYLGTMSTAMPDANFAVIPNAVTTLGAGGRSNLCSGEPISTTTFRIRAIDTSTGSAIDQKLISVAVFR